jgi:hypothetical protein
MQQLQQTKLGVGIVRQACMFIRALCSQLKVVGDGELQMEVDLHLFAFVQAHMEWNIHYLVVLDYCCQLVFGLHNHYVLYCVGLQTPQYIVFGIERHSVSNATQQQRI